MAAMTTQQKKNFKRGEALDYTPPAKEETASAPGKKGGRRHTAYEKTVREGGSAGLERGLGEMPLTLFLVAAATILFLYIRRSSVGIDLHPGERARAMPGKQPTVTITPRSRGGTPPVLPPVPHPGMIVP